jgi:hypothetical protein
MNAYELANYITENSYIGSVTMDGVANMLRQQADRIAHLEMLLANRNEIIDKLDLTTPQIKQLSDEELNKAFDYYCETDEGVLRFNYELRDEWKKEQLIRWKEALKKASEK